jgi:HSP20 family protein
MPAVDVVENDKGYEVTADLPGMDEKNIEVKVTVGVLTMKGERQEEKRREEQGLLSAQAQLRLVLTQLRIAGEC